MKKSLTILLWLGLSLLGALGLGALRVPVGWLLGPMLISMAISRPLALPERERKTVTTIGQWIVSSIMGARFSIEAVTGDMSYVLPMAAVIVLTGALCLFNGHLLRRWAGVDDATAFLGSLPGAASAVVAMSAELKVDRLMVAILTYVRVILLIVLTPLALSLIFGVQQLAPSERITSAAISPSLPMQGLTVLLALGGAWIARRLRIPSPNFMGPFLTIMLLKILIPSLNPGLPASFLQFGLLLLGASIGVQFNLGRLRHFARPASIQAGLIIALMGACMAAGYAFHRMTGIDLPTAIMGTTPGGKEAMIAMSMDMGAHIEMVITLQTMRWLLVLFAGPPLAVWMAKRGKNKREVE